MKKNIAVLTRIIRLAEIENFLFLDRELNPFLIYDYEMEALRKRMEGEEIHLILMNLEMEDAEFTNGIETIRLIRKDTAVPIIVISAQTTETAKILALNAGADDYVMFDDNPLVLLARVKAQLRRYTELVNLCGRQGRIYRVGDLILDDRNHFVTVNGRDVKMTPIEYKILRLLLKEQGKVLSIDRIYESIWQMRAVGADNTIAVHIRHIREKIESNPKEPRYLKVVWGEGYKVG